MRGTATALPGPGPRTPPVWGGGYSRTRPTACSHSPASKRSTAASLLVKGNQLNPPPVAHEVQQPDPYSVTFCHQAFPPLAPAPHQVQHQAFAGIEADAEVPLLPAHVVPLHLEAGALRSAQVSTQRPWAATAETTSGHGAHATSFMCVMQEGNRECGAYETDRLHGKAN